MKAEGKNAVHGFFAPKGHNMTRKPPFGTIEGSNIGPVGSFLRHFVPFRGKKIRGSCRPPHTRMRFGVAGRGKPHGLAAVNLHVLPAGPIQTNAYLLTAPERGEAVLIDAPGGVWAGVEQILKEEKCRLAELWLTHGHWDHIQGGAEVVRATSAVVRAHPADRVLIETPEVMERFMGERMNLEPVRVDHWLAQGEHLTALGVRVEVRHVPGHCPGNVLFYFPAFGTAFVGDALFRGSVGRSDLPGGDFPLLEKSIREQIYTLPDATVVCPGHGPETTVGDEKNGNPYVPG
jgi:glyoxylase-like metal-dependent hydrolase (beta-lactamase superfamily II)